MTQAYPLNVGDHSSYKVRSISGTCGMLCLHREKTRIRPTKSDSGKTLLTITLFVVTTNLLTLNQPHESVTITTWNCRGLSISEPYLKSISESSDIILIQEHWLWPYEMHKLSSVLCSYSANGMCDKRLDENSALKRGCGGVGIPWKKSMNASPVPLHLSTDRICAISLKLNETNAKQLAILNVYCPSSDADMDCFTQCVHDLEETLNLFDGESTALVIAGDFNAHLGSLAGLRGHGPPNEQGLVLKEFIDRNNLFVASHSQLSTGPPYTYHSGERFSTID